MRNIGRLFSGHGLPQSGDLETVLFGGFVCPRSANSSGSVGAICARRPIAPRSRVRPRGVASAFACSPRHPRSPTRTCAGGPRRLTERDRRHGYIPGWGKTSRALDRLIRGGRVRTAGRPVPHRSWHPRRRRRAGPEAGPQQVRRETPQGVKGGSKSQSSRSDDWEDNVGEIRRARNETPAGTDPRSRGCYEVPQTSSGPDGPTSGV